VILGLIFGVIIGLLFKEKVVYIKPVGDLFIRLIKMILIPLIFFAIIGGVSQISDTKKLGKIGIKASLYYILTTLCAILIGLSVGSILKPGVGVNLNISDAVQETHNPTVDKIINTLLNIVPDNIISAMAEGSFLQIVFFALFAGIILNYMKEEEKKRLSNIFQLLSAFVFKMIHVIVKLAPYAACALTAYVVGTQGILILKSLFMLFISAYVGLIVQYFVFGLLLKVFGGISPIPFYKKSLEYQAIAFSTSSSKAALPTTIRIAQEKLGISKTGSSFVLPLGASINMDGLAIYLSIATLFFAQSLGKTLSFSDYAMIVFTTSLGSIGGAGIPSAAIVMLPMILSSIGLPIEGIALIAGIDRLIDMMRTTISITGDVAVTLLVDISEGQLDKKAYNDMTSCMETTPT
jgi:Na+/H+-dicarboxylate symporter